MRPPEEAADVDWSALASASQESGRVGALIRTLYVAYGQPGNDSEDAAYGLDWALCVDWRDATPYPIATALIPFLAHAAVHLPERSEDLLLGLSTVAVQAQRPGPVSEQVSAALREACQDLCPACPTRTRCCARTSCSSSG